MNRNHLLATVALTCGLAAAAIAQNESDKTYRAPLNTGTTVQGTLPFSATQQTLTPVNPGLRDAPAGTAVPELKNDTTNYLQGGTTVQAPSALEDDTTGQQRVP